VDEETACDDDAWGYMAEDDDFASMSTMMVRGMMMSLKSTMLTLRATMRRWATLQKMTTASTLPSTMSAMRFNEL